MGLRSLHRNVLRSDINHTENGLMVQCNELLKKDICEKHKSKLVYVDCSRCGGHGEIEDYDSFCSGAMETCYACNGTGNSPWLECEDCRMENEDYESV